MHKLLCEFLEQHPEYFEGPRDALLLRPDLRPLFEEYAQAMDPEEYHDLKRRVEEFREQKKKDLQTEINAFLRQREEEEASLAEIQEELGKFEKEVCRLQRRLDQAIQEDEGTAVVSGKAWYSSGYMFLFLDFLGVFFLYIGIILNERLTLSYVVMGVVSIALGFFFQQSGSAARRVTSPDIEQLKSEIHHRQAEIKQISKVKRISLTNRKKVALRRISELNQKIEDNLLRINEHYRE